MIQAVSSSRDRRFPTRWRVLLSLVAAVFVVASCSSNSTVTVADETEQDIAESSSSAAGDENDAPDDESVDDDAPGDDDSDDDSPEDDAEGSDDSGGDASAASDSASDDDTSSDDASSDDASDDDTSDDESADADPSFAGADSGDFCRIAREIDENDPFEDPDLAFFSEEFFDTVLDFYRRVEAIAPDEIRPDFVTIRVGFEQFAAIAEEAEYNVLDPRFGEAIEAIDTTDFDEASENIEAYLQQVCGVDIGGLDDMTGSADGADPSAPVLPPGVPDEMLDLFGGVDLENLTDADVAALSQVLFSQLAADPELQACLLENIDLLLAAGEDPSVLTQEICGTTLLNIFAGLGG